MDFLYPIENILSLVSQKAFQERVFAIPFRGLQIPIQTSNQGSMGVGKSPLDLIDAKGVPADIVRRRQRIFHKQWIEGRRTVVTRKIVVGTGAAVEIRFLWIRSGSSRRILVFSKRKPASIGRRQCGISGIGDTCLSH